MLACIRRGHCEIAFVPLLSATLAARNQVAPRPISYSKALARLNSNKRTLLPNASCLQKPARDGRHHVMNVFDLCLTAIR